MSDVGNIRVLIAGGGTGGHLFPAIAVAEELAATHPHIDITFVGTAKGLEMHVIPHTIWDLITMDIPSLKGAGLLRKIKTFLSMPHALIDARQVLKNVRPSLVIGVGGYAAGPITLMAALSGIPTVAMEQNAIAGVTNRLLGRFVKKVFVMFEESTKYFPKKKVIVSGNPVRKKVRDSINHRPLKKDGFTLLVFGGSQGARAINEKVVEALVYLAEVREDLHIIHQIGRAENVERFCAIYRARGFSAEVYHFIEDMGRVYSLSDMVICRAGATSVAELTVAGKPAIFIPYPHAADNHQEANARALVSTGGATMILERELTGERLGEEIKRLLAEPFKIASMAEEMRRFGKPAAAEVVVRESMKLIK